MKLKPGQILSSAIDTTAVIIIRAPDRELSVTCGGVPMVDGKAAEAQAAPAVPAKSDGPTGAQLGKRYVDATETLELLCTKGGSAPLAVDGQPMVVKAPKPLPSSD